MISWVGARAFKAGGRTHAKAPGNKVGILFMDINSIGAPLFLESANLEGRAFPYSDMRCIGMVGLVW